MRHRGPEPHAPCRTQHRRRARWQSRSRGWCERCSGGICLWVAG
jgi:hypothetical protein